MNVSKKIYFAASIRGGQKDKELHKQIINELSRYGKVLTEHITANSTSHLGSKGEVHEIYAQDIKWLNESDVVVVEATQPSLGVGYEIAYAEQAGKPILCLYRPEKGKSLSAMISGSPHYKVENYKNIDEIKKIFSAYFS
jgi:nucleoside 2-deoxyribosyltransferase